MNEPLAGMRAAHASSGAAGERAITLNLDEFGDRNFFRLVWPYYVLRPY